MTQAEFWLTLRCVACGAVLSSERIDPWSEGWWPNVMNASHAHHLTHEEEISTTVSLETFNKLRREIGIPPVQEQIDSIPLEEET